MTLSLRSGVKDFFMLLAQTGAKGVLRRHSGHGTDMRTGVRRSGSSASGRFSWSMRENGQSIFWRCEMCRIRSFGRMTECRKATLPAQSRCSRRSCRSSGTGMHGGETGFRTQRSVRSRGKLWVPMQMRRDSLFLFGHIW